MYIIITLYKNEQSTLNWDITIKFNLNKHTQIHYKKCMATVTCKKNK